MKKVILFIAVISFACNSFGQICNTSFLGSKELYQCQQTKYTPAPKGYLPVFINHVGRHGARHVTKDVNTTYIYQLLQKADSANSLTTEGKLLKEKILRLEKVEKKSFKSISMEGKQEQVLLADRIYENYSNVFNTSKPTLHVDHTKEIRTVQTYEAFLAELKTKISEPIIIKQQNDTTLRFYDLSPSYTAFKEKGDWQQSLQQLRTTLHTATLNKIVAQRFFAPTFFMKLSAEELDDFISDLFGFITIAYSLQKEMAAAGYSLADMDLQHYLTCQQLQTLATIDNAEDFLVKGPGTNVSGIQVKIAVPLLADFIRTTDDHIQNKTVNAELRFCHAETIAPFAALLKLNGASTATTKPTSINKLWKAEKVIPLSANIEWILYKETKGENYLVKFLLNEKEVSIKGLHTTSAPYYSWNDVRNFYLLEMQHLNAGLETNYIKYLQAL